MRVLLVDDDAQFRATLRQVLSARPELVVVGEAADGGEAIRRAVELQPDVVLMDLAMPGINGLEATRQVKARGAAARVIVLTVHNEEAYRRAALTAGADAVLEKRRLGVDLLPALAAPPAVPRETAGA